MNSNSTIHYIVTANDGEQFPEKRRNTFGGCVNMIRRISERLGAEDAVSGPEDYLAFRTFVRERSGRRFVGGFRIDEVNVL